MRGLTALFTTRTPTEDEIRDLFDNRIILTDSNTQNPEGLASPCENNITNNASAVHRMKGKVPIEGMQVCTTMKRDTDYIKDGGDY